MSDSKKLKAPTKGMWECEFLSDLGSNKKGLKETYHASTAATLEAKGHVKIVKEIKVYMPKKAKK